MSKKSNEYQKILGSGLLAEVDVQMNKRSDSGEKMFRMDIKGVEHQASSVTIDDFGKHKMSEDKKTRIKGCATMWHENSEEIAVCMKSVFSMDEDYCARYNFYALRKEQKPCNVQKPTMLV